MSQSIQTTVLPNGLRIVTDSMETVETVSFGAWVDAGARHEEIENNGVAHLLEHMAFKGTARRDARQIAEEMDAVGGHLNAYTARENTAYYAKVLKEDVPLAVDIISDILQHSTIDAEELAREQAVVVQEISQALDTPDDIIFDYFQETAYPDQAMGRSVLGQADVVRTMRRDTLLSFMNTHYSPSRLMISAAGRVDHDQLVELVSENFTALPPDQPRKEEKAVYRGGDFRESRDLEQVHVLFGFDGVAYDDPDFYAVSVLSTLLGGGMSSRLFQEIREKRGLVYSIYSMLNLYRDAGSLAVYAGCAPERAAQVVELTLAEFRRLRERPVAHAELERARECLKGSIVLGLESSSNRMTHLAQQMIYHGRCQEPGEILKAVDRVTAREIRDLAHRLFDPSSFALTALGAGSGAEFGAAPMGA